MKLNSGQLMGIFIVIIMLGSTAGFALWSSGNKNGGTTDTTPPPIDNPTVLDFSAANVNAKVVQTMPTIILFANTDEAQIDKIDSEIYAIKGVKQISSFYRSNTDSSLGGIGMKYVANIVYDQKITSLDSILSAIDGNSKYLSGAAAGQYALVSVPKIITFKNEKLGITKDYNSDGLLQVIAESETAKDDSLEINIDSQFAGNQLVKINAYEVKNITAEPQVAFFTAAFPVYGLSKSMNAFGTYNYGKTIDANKLKDEISKVSGITELNMQEFGTARIIKLNFENSAAVADLNAKLPALAGVESAEYDSGMRQFVVNFTSAADYAKLVSEINSAAGAAIQDKNFQIIEPEKRVSFDLNLSTENAGKIRGDVNAIFAKYGLQGAFSQKADIKTDMLLTPEQYSFAVEGGVFEANVIPGHEIGNEVSLDIYVSGSRGIAETIFASESLNTE